MIDSKDFEYSLQSLGKKDEINIDIESEYKQYPSSLTLVYKDVDGNIIENDYKLIELSVNPMYELAKTYYKVSKSSFYNQE